MRNTICTTCGQTARIVFSSPVLGTCRLCVHDGVSHTRLTGGSFRRNVFNMGWSASGKSAQRSPRVSILEQSGLFGTDVVSDFS